MPAALRRETSDTRLMVRIAQMYYRMDLSQEQIGDRLGLSRFRVGRLLDRALGSGINPGCDGHRRPPPGSAQQPAGLRLQS